MRSGQGETLLLWLSNVVQYIRGTQCDRMSVFTFHVDRVFQLKRKSTCDTHQQRFKDLLVILCLISQCVCIYTTMCVCDHICFSSVNDIDETM